MRIEVLCTVFNISVLNVSEHIHSRETHIRLEGPRRVALFFFIIVVYFPR